MVSDINYGGVWGVVFPAKIKCAGAVYIIEHGLFVGGLGLGP